MEVKVDLKFFGFNEGGMELDGYVPLHEDETVVEQSGVTNMNFGTANKLISAAKQQNQNKVGMM